MASTATETVKVKGLSKFGFQLESGEYINFSKTLNEAEKGKIVPGGEYEVEMYRADSGKGYVNKVLGQNANIPLVASVFKDTPLVKEVKPSRLKPANDTSMSKDEWSEKDKRIGRAGVIQVAVQITSNFDDAVLLANKMLKYIWTNNDNQA